MDRILTDHTGNWIRNGCRQFLTFFNRCLMQLADMSAKVIYASVDILIYIFTGRSRYSLRFYDVSISKVPQKRLHSWPFLTKWLTVTFDFGHY